MSNVIEIRGNAGSGIELRYTASGMPVGRFRLADSFGQGDKKQTTWWDVTMFGEAVVGYQQDIYKGVRMAIRGHAAVRTFTKRDGTQGWSAEVICEEILELQAPRGAGAPPAGERDPLL